METIGHKDLSTKIPFIFQGVLVLAGINLLPFVWIRYPHWQRWWLIGTVIMGVIFWRMRRVVAKLRYRFEDNGDVIVIVPSGKELTLPAAQIEKRERVSKLPRRRGRGIWYLPWTQELSFTTARTHLLRLEMSDGKTVWLSPKHYPED